MPNRTENPRSPIEVVGGILWRGKQFLAAQRPEGRGHAGFWEFPGGKVEQGETREQALTRELAEELSITPVQFGSGVRWNTPIHRNLSAFTFSMFWTSLVPPALTRVRRSAGLPQKRPRNSPFLRQTALFCRT